MAPLIQSYGRRRGRPLKRSRAALVADVLPSLAIAQPAEGATLDVARLFARPPAAVWLEIGFGGGEHLAAAAETHRHIGFIGAEPYINGIAGLLARVRAAQLDNLRLWPDDIRKLLPAFPAATLQRVFILFPDPWPKARHHKRRLIAPPLLDDLARVMAADAELRIATDDPDYQVWIGEQLAADRRFEKLAETTTRPADWQPTRYEQKALAAGRVPRYWRYRKRA